MKQARMCILIMLALVLVTAGCVRQAPGLVGTPTPRFTPTPAPTPTPQLIPLPSDTDVDAAGEKIASDAHFMRYLTFQWVRIYEYEGDTFLDGICNNTYLEPLTGAFEIVYREDSGRELARAPILIKSDDGLLLPGENDVYAQIDTDMDIQLLPFEIEITQRVWPMMQMSIVE